MRAKRVLFIDHARALGGSAVSLRCMLEHLDRDRYEPVVALACGGPEVERYYQAAGVPTVAWSGIERWEHTTAEWAALGRPWTWPQSLRTAAGWIRTARRTRELIAFARPALVHLNSAVLAPSASVLHEGGIPFVWHVRECPVRGYFGFRARAQRSALARWPSAAVFLSETERRTWMREPRGHVVPEPIDLQRFDPAIDGGRARAELGIDADAKVIAYVGGLSIIKGFFPLVQALGVLRRRHPNLICLMPGTRLETPRSPLYPIAKALLPLVGRSTMTEQIRRDLERLDLMDVCRTMPFSDDVPQIFAAADVVVFPSTTDHFARPLVEAGAMQKPVVASRHPMLEEQVRHGETGLLVPPGEPDPLAEALHEILVHPQLARRMGHAGRELARERFDARNNTRAMMDLYDDVLAAGREGARSCA